eukprot:TRINITY_DN1576_c0_g3_i1.p1 TRINITY_DN1576_c0_g3~~TRINITY_DN1576_c0_g3_i1.p1  ORF type:complete len:909 (+),score=285.37 TRINITY_DN1576_c0_g3_i1:70-2796(+)
MAADIAARAAVFVLENATKLAVAYHRGLQEVVEDESLDAAGLSEGEKAAQLEAAMLEQQSDAFEDATLVSQIFSGVFFTGLGVWLLFANGTKLSFVQRASLEKRLTVCCFINTYVAVFSAFFNFFQLTDVDNFYLPRQTQFVLDMSRPIEWIVTCPMMQLVLVLMGGSRIPEYRRWFMPMLSALILCCGTTSMLLDGPTRFVPFFVGFSIALFMWFHNAKQIQEHSNDDETMFYGDSEFRKASVLLIATWFPFPCWFLISAEGLGLITNVLIIQVGWAFLNIVSKFTFIFYIQRIKDNYCSRLKVKREMTGMMSMSTQMQMANLGPGGDGGGTFEERESRKTQGELNAVVVETMTFLGMAQHTDRFARLLARAKIRSNEQVEELTKEQAEELQLPWDLISALQRRIHVWSLEMRDEAEIELERGERHYDASDCVGHEGMGRQYSPGGFSALQNGMTMPGVVNGGGAASSEVMQQVEQRVGAMEGVLQAVLEHLKVREDRLGEQMENMMVEIRKNAMADDNSALIDERLQAMSRKTEGLLAQMQQQVGEQLQPALAHAAEAQKGTESLLTEIRQLLVENIETNTGGGIMKKIDIGYSETLRRLTEWEEDAANKLEDIVIKAVAKASGKSEKAMEGVAGAVTKTMESMFVEQRSKLEDSLRQNTTAERVADVLRAGLQNDVAQLMNRTETNHTANQSNMSSLLNRLDTVAEMLRDQKEANKDSHADLKRRCSQLGEQVELAEKAAKDAKEAASRPLPKTQPPPPRMSSVDVEGRKLSKPAGEAPSSQQQPRGGLSEAALREVADQQSHRSVDADRGDRERYDYNAGDRSSRPPSEWAGAGPCELASPAPSSMHQRQPPPNHPPRQQSAPAQRAPPPHHQGPPGSGHGDRHDRNGQWNGQNQRPHTAQPRH